MGVGWKHIFYFLNKNSLYKDKYTQPQKVPQEDLSWFVAVVVVVVVVVVVIRSHTGNKVLQRKQITSPSNECRNIPFVTEIGRKITKENLF